MTQNSTEKERAGRYTKKPITIEAVQYGRRFDWPDWFHDAVSANTVVTHGTGKFADETDLCFCEIKTLEGVMRCNEGDWIIRGVKGELYPCKPDVFAATYEPEQAARRAPAVPQGLKLTEEMHVAAVKVLHRASGLDGLPQRMVDAILAAAPEPSTHEPKTR